MSRGSGGDDGRRVAPSPALSPAAPTNRPSPRTRSGPQVLGAGCPQDAETLNERIEAVVGHLGGIGEHPAGAQQSAGFAVGARTRSLSSQCSAGALSTAS
jgi:hypothetical protein